jgi:hypothetical protein
MAKPNIRGLGLTAKQWGLHQGNVDPWNRTVLDLVADALNQALREAATVVQDELGSREGGASPSLRGQALMAIIVRALYDKWVDVAEQHKKHGAADDRVRERAAVALRNLFAGAQEEVSMREMLGRLEEAKKAVPRDMVLAADMLAILSNLDMALTKEMDAFIEADPDVRKGYFALVDGKGRLGEALRAYLKRRRAEKFPVKGTR